MKDCVLCKNPDYTWYEVIRENCGNPLENVYNLLCKQHQIVFRDQIKDLVSQKLKDRS